MEWIIIIGVIIFALGFFNGKGNSNSSNSNQKQKNSILSKYSGLINCMTSDLAYCLEIIEVNSNNIKLEKQLTIGGYIAVLIEENNQGLIIYIGRENKGKTVNSTIEFNEFENQHIMYDKVSKEYKILYFMLEGCTREQAENLTKLK